MTAAHDTKAQDLHGAIMNLTCTPPADANINQRLSYKSGHRDARHAAAELALTALDSRLQEKEGQPALSEREKFEAWKRSMQDGFNEWDAWQARATLAAGSQAVQVPGWRPIDSAPKDGSQIDVWIGDEREPDVFWGTPKLGHRAPCWCRHTYDPYWGWVPESVGTPSHWMPKPLQPLAGGEVL